MKGNKFTGPIAVSTIEDLVLLHNLNADAWIKNFNKLAKKNKKVMFIGLINLGLSLYLLKRDKDKSDSIDRLKEKVKDIESSKSKDIDWDYDFGDDDDLK